MDACDERKNEQTQSQEAEQHKQEQITTQELTCSSHVISPPSKDKGLNYLMLDVLSSKIEGFGL